MGQNVSRRKYAHLVRFLTATMRDEKASHRVRFAAAARLDDLYARADARVEKARDREHRREIAELQAKAGSTTAKAALAAIEQERAEAEAEESAEDQRINDVFDTVLKPDKET